MINLEEYKTITHLNVYLFISVFVLFCLLVAAMLWLKEPGTTCASFSSYRAAMLALPLYPKLDADKDGKPCEKLLLKNDR